MGLTTTTALELETRAKLAFHQAETLLRQVGPDVRLSDGGWTSGDVAAHLLTVLYRYTRRDFSVPSGLADSPAGVTDANQEDIAAVAGMGFEAVMDEMAHEFEQFLKLELDLDAEFPFHAGQTIDGAGGRSNMIGELLVHGYDVAAAAGRAWPLAERDFVLILNGVLQIVGGWLDPATSAGVRMDVALRVRGATPQLMRIADGRVEVRDLAETDRPDAVIRAGAVALGLYFYKRITLAQAARRGVLITGGRRPWTGMSVGKMFLQV